MKLNKFLLACLILINVALNPVYAAVFMIGDDDGYGAGIANNSKHNFDGFNANYDGRSDAEKSAVNGAQFTDTYSTTHSGFSPQTGTVATFIFSGLGTNWTVGKLEFDMADFEASKFGAVAVDFNGIGQDWGFNDGSGNTVLRSFDLQKTVLDSINGTGQLIITINRDNQGKISKDFYGFDFAKLTNNSTGNGNGSGNVVPIPAAFWLFGSALFSVLSIKRHR